ncbi:MAG: hypothetical protein A3H49_00580 [Nitrospirae bacterium RIFCSPLOWO2_02_FULL_62_14]|nr:MAG: hypothetical protein A3H49_00580 [Nitrospirae bacterium RIFCSPLOWO2_02_FULL_62_14]
MITPERLEPDDERRRFEQAQRALLLRTAEFLAKLLDSAVRIPGTNLYIGLDPLLGLLPGIGDALANLIGSVILILGIRLNVPRATIVRMNLNLLINGVVGAIPVIGDAFSVWFRSNALNAALLARAASDPTPRAETRDRLAVTLMVTGTLALLLVAIGTVMALCYAIWQFIAQLWPT